MSYQRSEDHLISKVKTTSDICEHCKKLDKYQRKVVEEVIEGLLGLNVNDREALHEILSKQGSGSISFSLQSR